MSAMELVGFQWAYSRRPVRMWNSALLALASRSEKMPKLHVLALMAHVSFHTQASTMAPEVKSDPAIYLGPRLAGIVPIGNSRRMIYRGNQMIDHPTLLKRQELVQNCFWATTARKMKQGNIHQIAART